MDYQEEIKEKNVILNQYNDKISNLKAQIRLKDNRIEQLEYDFKNSLNEYVNIYDYENPEINDVKNTKIHYELKIKKLLNSSSRLNKHFIENQYE